MEKIWNCFRSPVIPQFALYPQQLPREQITPQHPDDRIPHVQDDQFWSELYEWSQQLNATPTSPHPKPQTSNWRQWENFDEASLAGFSSASPQISGSGGQKRTKLEAELGSPSRGKRPCQASTCQGGSPWMCNEAPDVEQWGSTSTSAPYPQQDPQERTAPQDMKIILGLRTFPSSRCTLNNTPKNEQRPSIRRPVLA
jgi:hypothetical protein